MGRIVAVLASLSFFTSSLAAQEMPLFGWGGAPEHLGGLMIVRQGGQKTVSVGGILFSRRVKLTTATPDGPVVTRFVLPSALHSPVAVPVPGMSPATLQIEIPDPIGLLYIDGQMLQTPGGTARILETQPLAPGKVYALKLRGVYARGGQLLIEDRTITLAAGQSSRIEFAGNAAIAVPLPREVGRRSEVLPASNR
jgi:hypothetical protein